jgi:hypothetical protein
MSRSYIRKVLDAWQSWRFHRAMMAASPEYARLRAADKRAKAQHRKRKAIQHEMSDALHAELRREVVHG